MKDTIYWVNLYKVKAQYFELIIVEKAFYFEKATKFLFSIAKRLSISTIAASAS